MESHLAVLLPVAAVWLAAGYVADGLPRIDRAHALRRRAGWSLVLTLTGLGLTAAVLTAGLSSGGATMADRAAGNLALAGGPAALVALCAVRRLRRLWAGAGAFAAAPDTPAPHGLRAAAAHPMIGLPVQVTGLATVPALLTAGGADLLVEPGVTGPAITVGALCVAVLGVRHALRHNRLAERALPAEPLAPTGWAVPVERMTLAEPAEPASVGAAGPLHV
ncbi:hypothetical protein GA0070609_5921 [Micromonospora echinaurantiaca]|uniref:Uncharacterized protein n=1 Tax=Micromonospora echinaurantiaca TaxID=47857 RepID=A0A1C5K9V7_9ACTN|nr:hypothetical protein [Micromonospora echinaurantiaca]SCG79508.1 hypothetical protein GA0070609_5921 [Micromonospora echinaurantiaca]